MNLSRKYRNEKNKFLEKVLEYDVDDVLKITAESFEVVCSPEAYFNVKDLLQSSDINLSNSELTLVPTQEKKLNEKYLEQTEKMIDLLEEVDDVQKVYTNAVL